MFRFLNKLYAKAFGYFWLPCPICGQPFGGHEIRNIWTAALICENGQAHCVCPDRQCSAAAVTLNISNGHPQAIPSPWLAGMIANQGD